MTAAILGDNPQAWLVAAHASASSGEPVGLVAPGFADERITLDVRYRDDHRRAVLDLVGQLRDGDTCVVVAAPELAVQRKAILATLADLAGRTVILAPGGAGGVVGTASRFHEAGLPVPTLAELTGFPILGAMVGRTVHISTIKRRLPIGVQDAAATDRVLDSVRVYLPDLVGATSVLETSLANTNNIVHPPIALVNAARIEAGIPFRFYREGLTAAGAGLIDAVDRERLAVTDALGLERVPIATWFDRFYGDQGMAGNDIGTKLSTFGPFADSLGPSGLSHRYLVDDVGSGLAVIAAIGARLGQEMPVTSGICELISALVGQDLQAQAATTASALLKSGRIAPPTSGPPGDPVGVA